MSSSWESARKRLAVRSVGRFLVMLSCCLGLAGCGSASKPVPLRGTVTYKGQRLDNGTVMFSPADKDKGRVAQGTIQPDGSFALSTFQPGDGAIAAEYMVTVTSTVKGTEPIARDKGTGIGGKSAIPAKYGDPKTSTLRKTVSSSDSGQPYSIELTD
jgi:hypothetical protein